MGEKTEEALEKPFVERPGRRRENQPLNIKQNAWWIGYLQSKDPTEAAKVAGYSPKNAYWQGQHLLNDPRIQKRLASYREQMSRNAIISVKQVILNLLDVYDRAIAKGRLADANRSLELVGKHLGAFTEKLEITDKSKPEMTPQERAEHLRSQMRILDEQEKAGTAIPIE